MLKAATRAGEISFDLTKTVANFQPHAVDEITRRHSLARFRLHLEHAHRCLLATLHYELILLRHDQLAIWNTRPDRDRRLRFPKNKTLRIELRISVGPRLKTSDASLNNKSALRPVDQTVFFCQHWREGGISIVLRTRRESVETCE